MMFSTYQFDSSYNKDLPYQFNIDEKPTDENWMEYCDYSNYKTILRGKKKLNVSYIDCELIKYCLDSLEEFAGTILTNTYKGIASETAESIFYQIVDRSKNLKNIETKHIYLLDLDVLSRHLTLETVNFKFYKEFKINHTEYKRSTKLIIKTNNSELMELNEQYNHLNIYFIN